MIHQLIPAFTPLWQVSAGPTGEVVFTRVVCIAMAEDDNGVRFPAPMIPGVHLRVPDVDETHIGYAADGGNGFEPNPEPWAQRCKDRREALDAAERDAAHKPKILLPSKRIVRAKDVMD